MSAPDLRVETWEVARLIPYAGNPRKNAHAVEPMAQAIREYGFRVPVLARSTGEVVDGHLRLQAARVAGLTHVPVILCDDMTPAQVRAFRISVNKMAELADWDVELLRVEFGALRAMDYDIALTGFPVPEIEKIEDIDDGLGNLPEPGSAKERDNLIACPKCGYRHAKV